jgi:acyl-CoA thioesterase-1
MHLLKNILLVASLAAGLSACGSERHYAAIPPQARVVILGDSLTYGTGAGSGEDYPSLLAQNTGWDILNAGVPGDTSAEALSRLPDLLDGQKIDLLIVAIGGNDFLRHIPEADTRRHLEAILQQAQAHKTQALLLAIPKLSLLSAAVGSLSDHPLYAEIAKQTGTPLVADVFADVLEKKILKADQIHPNAEGYRLVEKNLRQALIELGFLPAK